MATIKKETEPIKMTPTQLKKKIEELQEKLNRFSSYGYCYMCDTLKSKDPENNKFYISTDPRVKSGITPICKECARKIALRIDKDGLEHEPTKESIQLALRYLDKPYLEAVWNTSVQEYENVLSGRPKQNVWAAYIRNISMTNYYGKTYSDSDFYQHTSAELKETEKDDVLKEISQDLYTNFIKNKNDVIRLIGYDPFAKEDASNQPLLYSQLLGLLDKSGDNNDDIMRVNASISIARNVLQKSKIDDTLVDIMGDVTDIKQNSAVIKTLNESKSKIDTSISKLSEDNCISLKHNKNAKKGEDSWTGKIKKVKELNLRQGEVNGFDIGTCRGMYQVMNMSDASILKQLHLDESEYSDMLAEMRQTVTLTRKELDQYKEICRILLSENLDLKDTLNENNMLDKQNCIDLDEVFSTLSTIDEEETDFLNIITEGGDKDAE